MSATEDVSQEPRGWLKELAMWNICFMSVTAETFHATMFSLKFSRLSKRRLMSVTADTSHSAMSP